jgi:isocitrate/isopropylmalate dehydrogenase
MVEVEETNGFQDVPDHISLWGLILPIRKALNQYVNVRPTRILEGTKSPLEGCKRDDLDWMIIRENSEGEYSGQGGTSHESSPHTVATEVSIVCPVHACPALIVPADDPASSHASASSA